MKYVIIGAGPAGVIAAETLRKLDPDSKITLIGDEPEPPYSRMALPYYLVKKIPEQGTYLRKSENHFKDQRIEMSSSRVIRIKPDQHILTLNNGNTLIYDKLLIATGAHPASPPVEGVDLPGVLPCWTLDNARNIIALAKPGAKVVLMGAGFIGCIILEALAKSGAELTVVEMENRMVPRMMDDKAGNLIKQWCIQKGIRVFTSTRVEKIEQDSESQGTDGCQSPLNVILDNSQVITADLVVTATGVKANISFLEGSGIKTEQGVLINRNMQTNFPDIYAAGDVAQGLDFSTGDYSVQAIQPTAVDHGKLAGHNMSGLTEALHQGSINMNVLDTLGLISSSFGLWMGVEGGEEAVLLNSQRFKYMNLQFQGDSLVGATSIGLTQHVGVLRGLIQSKVKLGDWKAKLINDPTRIMEAYLANTQLIGIK
ncbi:MAG: FAD-dependent oxidoreductase [Methylococcales bacterium]